MKKIFTLVFTFYAMTVLSPFASACEGHHHEKTTQKEHKEVKEVDVNADVKSK